MPSPGQQGFGEKESVRELLREEIAETVSGPSEVEEELRSLRRALAS